MASNAYIQLYFITSQKPYVYIIIHSSYMKYLLIKYEDNVTYFNFL